jgi:hypothetical protein
VTQQPAPGPAISAGTLAYMFGDRVVQPAGSFGGTEVPWSGVRVSVSDLSAVVFAVSFWSLRECGALQLRLTRRRSFGLFRQHGVAVAPGPETGPRTGYEDAVLQQVGRGAGSAYDVVRGWFGRDVCHPEGAVLGLAQQEMLQAGYAQEVGAGESTGGVLPGRTRVEPLTDRIGAAHTRFDRVHAGWQRFCDEEAALAGALVETCRRAIRSRQESEDD